MKIVFLVLGVLLILVGILSFVDQGITYTTREEVVDIGPLQASTETSETIPIPPVVGGLALAGGAALLVAGVRCK